MRILVTGASGLIGGHVVRLLQKDGHTIATIGRAGSHGGPGRGAVDDFIPWDPDKGTLDPARLEGADAVVHLAGESIAGGRWTQKQKQKIHDSRSRGTQLLARTLAGLARPPIVLVSASAVGYYGDRGDETLDESAAPGNDFLAGVCRDWEAAAEPARAKGIRVVHPRFGIVLSKDGGALAKMLPPFLLGAGGVIGSGHQYMSWIALDDVAGAIRHALLDDSLQGPVNAVAPRPVTNKEFTKTLGDVLSRPTIFPLPAFAARLLLGEMADGLLLSSQRAVPAKLTATGFAFRNPELDGALRVAVGKTER